MAKPYTPPKSISLGGDQETEIEFKIGESAFTVFPLDEIEIISRLAEDHEKASGAPPKDEAFWTICQSRLAKYGVRASLLKSGEWYTALCNAYQEQIDFFAGSPASSDSTDSQKTGDDQTNSQSTNESSSPQSGTPSKPKRSRKTS